MTSPTVIAETPQAAPDAATDEPQDAFEQLMQHGAEAFEAGRLRRAHRLWRRAAVLRPSDEQVWWLLLNVVETEADQLVCYHNITVINDQQTELAAMLAPHRQLTQANKLPSDQLVPLANSVRRGVRWLLVCIEVLVISGFVLVALIILLNI